jgi:hypothetical protein
MIVELVGCAGAGKTTLRRLICERGVSGHQVIAMPDLVLERPALRRITHPTAVNVAQELGSLPFLLRAVDNHRPFLSFARRTLWDHASWFDRLNGMRGIARKVGMHELARMRAQAALVLADEGTLLSSYNLFVATKMDFGEAELSQFANLVPKPDFVVHVRAPIALLVQRAKSRPDPRRQHIGRDMPAIEADVRRTVHLFDRLVETEPLAGRVLTVESSELDPEGRIRLADEVVDGLLAVLPTQRPRQETGASFDSSRRENH